MYLPINNICHSRINGPGNRLVIWVQGVSSIVRDVSIQKLILFQKSIW